MKISTFASLLLAAASLRAQAPAPDPSIDKVLGAVESLSALVENFDKVANSPVPASQATSATALRNGSAKAAIARATAGAATGAAIGAMTRKGEHAVIAGAIIGAVAGIVYDRVKVSQEHKAQQEVYAAEAPSAYCEVPAPDPAFAH